MHRQVPGFGNLILDETHYLNIKRKTRQRIQSVQPAITTTSATNHKLNTSSRAF